jgi:hypothetical protein
MWRIVQQHIDYITYLSGIRLSARVLGMSATVMTFSTGADSPRITVALRGAMAVRLPEA